MIASSLIRSGVAWLAVALALPLAASGASLTPDRGSLLRQTRSARAGGFTFLADERQLARAVAAGELVPLAASGGYVVKGDVPFPFARPAVRSFVEWLGDRYRGECGARLVITSLVRPRDHQPPNSSPLSVHPTGLALDLRIPWDRNCRRWLESTLIDLEAHGVVEAARERRPAHYHVMVLPGRFASYRRRHPNRGTARQAAAPRDHRVRRGESLWSIARRYGTTVARLQEVNDLDGAELVPGQLLALPVR